MQLKHLFGSAWDLHATNWSGASIDQWSADWHIAKVDPVALAMVAAGLHESTLCKRKCPLALLSSNLVAELPAA